MAAKNEDVGFVDIKLRRSIDVGGVAVKALRMREPTVNDQLTVQEMKCSEVQQEIHMISNLCDIAPDDVKKLTLRDYRKVQQAFMGFTEAETGE